jgi:hypothetical protein
MNCAIGSLIMMGLCVVQFGYVDFTVASTVFFDDFNDGNAGDGQPVSWVPLVGNFPGTYNASSGDYLLKPAAPGGAAVSVVPQVLPNVSIRAQIRIPESSDVNDNIAVAVRGNTTTLDTYLAGIDAGGEVFIGRPNTTVGCCIRIVPTDLRPTVEDVIIQFDAFGNRLRFWAWRSGALMPSTPQIDVTDSALTSGIVSLIYTSETDTPVIVNTPGSALIRYVHVADTHIPEPCSFVIAAVAFAAIMFGRVHIGRSTRHA